MKLSEIIKLIEKYPHKVMLRYEYFSIQDEFLFNHFPFNNKSKNELCIELYPNIYKAPKGDMTLEGSLLNKNGDTYYNLIEFLKFNGMPDLCNNKENEHTFISSIINMISNNEDIDKIKQYFHLLSIKNVELNKINQRKLIDYGFDTISINKELTPKDIILIVKEYKQNGNNELYPLIEKYKGNLYVKFLLNN